MSTQVSEITTLSELLEKVEEYKVTTSHLRISHPNLTELQWTIPDIPEQLIADLVEAYPTTKVYRAGGRYSVLFAGDGYGIFAQTARLDYLG